jgi:hypothetical protein
MHLVREWEIAKSGLLIDLSNIYDINGQSNNRATYNV